MCIKRYFMTKLNWIHVWHIIFMQFHCRMKCSEKDVYCVCIIIIIKVIYIYIYVRRFKNGKMNYTEVTHFFLNTIKFIHIALHYVELDLFTQCLIVLNSTYIKNWKPQYYFLKLYIFRRSSIFYLIYYIFDIVN